MDLALLVHNFTSDFPPEEKYSLSSQLRRCAVSIPSNIAEGWARKNTGEYINSLSIANGSVAELDTQLILSERLHLGKVEILKGCQLLREEIQRMLPTMIKSLQSNS